jgi:hypothetical protein
MLVADCQVTDIPVCDRFMQTFPIYYLTIVVPVDLELHEMRQPKENSRYLEICQPDGHTNACIFAHMKCLLIIVFKPTLALHQNLQWKYRPYMELTRKSIQLLRSSNKIIYRRNLEGIKI